MQQATAALAFIAVVGATAAQGPRQEQLPPAGELVDRALDASGGEKVIREITSSHTKATISGKDSAQVVEAFRAAPSKVRFIMADGERSQEVAYNGEVGWTRGIFGPEVRIIDAGAARKMSSSMASAAFFGPLLSWKDRGARVETVAEVEFGGEACYEVRVEKEPGSFSHAYFSVDRGLLVGLEEHAGEPELTLTQRYTDWKVVRGVKVYTRIVSEQNGNTTVTRFETIEFNAVDDAVFDPPASAAEHQ